MIAAPKNVLCPPLSSDRACVSYLFRKRWPEGFRCSFCGALQKEMPPACVVVCRYCRKQNSITAHTLMHGSKKSLVAWMLVAWQFCLREQGMSARELQRLMELSCYQTAWSWLQKIRQGMALAESIQCRGTVLFDKYLLSVATAQKSVVPEIAIALESDESEESIRRVRFEVVQAQEGEIGITALKNMVATGSVLLVPELNVLPLSILQSYSCCQCTSRHKEQGQRLFQKMEFWLNNVYRRAIDVGHLQSYLDEFSFRYNTSFWQDHFTVFDHLVTGLVAVTREDRRTADEK